MDIELELGVFFGYSLILEGEQTRVEMLKWVPGETLRVPVDFDAYQRVTLVLSGTTRFTRQPALYRIQVNR